MTPRRLLFVFLGVLTALRLIYVTQIELFPDESYYFMWSERMDISYFSKGPGVAVAIWIGTHLFGANEFGVRVLSPLLGLGTSLLMFSFGRRLFSEETGIWCAILINLLPIFNVGSLVMTIDPLSIFFWAAALYTFWLALEKSPETSLWWPATGALIGMGFLAKYTNAMQLVSVLLVLIFTPKFRREFRQPGFYLMLAVFVVFSLPPIIWNARHDWITLEHLSARGGLKKAFHLNLGEFFQFLGVHFAVYSPLVFGGMLLAIGWGFKKAQHHFKPRFLLAFTLPLFVLYFSLALKQAGEANWTAPATLSLGLLTTALWIERMREQLWMRKYAVTALLIALGSSLLILNLDLVRSAGIRLPYSFDPGKRMRGWRSAAAKIESFRVDYERQTGEPVFLIASDYGTAASLAFYFQNKRVEGPGHPPVYIPESQEILNQFSFWRRYDEFVDPKDAPHIARDEYYTEEAGVNPFMGRNALYITDRAEERAPSSIKNGFEHVEMVACLDEIRRGLPLRQLRIFACQHYRSVPL